MTLLTLVGAAIVCAPIAAARAYAGQSPPIVTTVTGTVSLRPGTNEKPVPLQGARVKFESPGWFQRDPDDVTYTGRDGRYKLIVRTTIASEYVLSVEAPDGERQRSRGPVKTGTESQHDFTFEASRDYVSAFRDGIKKLDSYRGSAALMAAGAFQEAIELAKRIDMPVTQVRIYGLRREPYAPNYFRSQALFEARECDGLNLVINDTEKMIKDREANIQRLLKCPLRRADLAPTPSHEEWLALEIEALERFHVNACVEPAQDVRVPLLGADQILLDSEQEPHAAIDGEAH